MMDLILRFMRAATNRHVSSRVLLLCVSPSLSNEIESIGVSQDCENLTTDGFLASRRRGLSLMLSLLVTVTLAACAPGVSMQRVAPEMDATDTTVYVLDHQVSGRSSAGYSRTLPAGSRWRRIGRVPTGDILKSPDVTLTVEGAHIHEADIVVRDGSWVGFWLPVEKAFSRLESPIAISFTTRMSQ